MCAPQTKRKIIVDFKIERRDLRRGRRNIHILLSLPLTAAHCQSAIFVCQWNWKRRRLDLPIIRCVTCACVCPCNISHTNTVTVSNAFGYLSICLFLFCFVVLFFARCWQPSASNKCCKCVCNGARSDGSGGFIWCRSFRSYSFYDL